MMVVRFAIDAIKSDELMTQVRARASTSARDMLPAVERDRRREPGIPVIFDKRAAGVAFCLIRAANQ